MNKWPYEVKHYSPSEVQEYCVRNAAWQALRLKMKGQATTIKLQMLEHWVQGRRD